MGGVSAFEADEFGIPCSSSVVAWNGKELFCNRGLGIRINLGSGKYPTAFPWSSHCWCGICVRVMSDRESVGLNTSTEDEGAAWGKREIRSNLTFLLKGNQWIKRSRKESLLPCFPSLVYDLRFHPIHLSQNIPHRCHRDNYCNGENNVTYNSTLCVFST